MQTRVRKERQSEPWPTRSPASSRIRSFASGSRIARRRSIFETRATSGASASQRDSHADHRNRQDLERGARASTVQAGRWNSGSARQNAVRSHRCDSGERVPDDAEDPLRQGSRDVECGAVSRLVDLARRSSEPFRRSRAGRGFGQSEPWRDLTALQPVEVSVAGDPHHSSSHGPLRHPSRDSPNGQQKLKYLRPHFLSWT